MVGVKECFIYYGISKDDKTLPSQWDDYDELSLNGSEYLWKKIECHYTDGDISVSHSCLGKITLMCQNVVCL